MASDNRIADEELFFTAVQQPDATGCMAGKFQDPELPVPQVETPGPVGADSAGLAGNERCHHK